jgi:predicted transcriptional regulator
MKPNAPRSIFEIWMDILKALEKKPMKITHITHAVNINGRRAKECLDDMLHEGLIEVETTPKSSRVSFSLTERGRQVLDVVEKVRNENANNAIPMEIRCAQKVLNGGTRK